jgi:hypothetical protein
MYIEDLRTVVATEAPAAAPARDRAGGNCRGDNKRQRARLRHVLLTAAAGRCFELAAVELVQEGKRFRIVRLQTLTAFGRLGTPYAQAAVRAPVPQKTL